MSSDGLRYVSATLEGGGFVYTCHHLLDNVQTRITIPVFIAGEPVGSVAFVQYDSLVLISSHYERRLVLWDIKTDDLIIQEMVHKSDAIAPNMLLKVTSVGLLLWLTGRPSSCTHTG